MAILWFLTGIPALILILLIIFIILGIIWLFFKLMPYLIMGIGILILILVFIYFIGKFLV